MKTCNLHARAGVIAAAIAALAPPAHAVTTSAYLKWLINGTDTSLPSGKAVLTTKALRLSDTNPADTPDNTQFRLLYYYYYASTYSSNGDSYNLKAAQSIPALKNLGLTGNVSDFSFTLPTTDTYYYFATQPPGAYASFSAYSPYIKSTNVRGSSSSDGVNVTGEGSGKAGVTDVRIGGGANTQLTTDYVGGDPTEQISILYFPSAVFTNPGADPTGLFDQSTGEFQIANDSEWNALINEYGTAPSGWSFQFARTTLTNSDFIEDPSGTFSAANDLLTVTDNNDTIGQIVTYEIIDRFAWSDGTVTYYSEPVAGYEGAVPEPDAWALAILGFGCVGLTQRRRRTSDTARAKAG